MNPTQTFSKLCYRCGQAVRLTAEQFSAQPNAYTCCEVCRVKLDTEAGFAGVPLSQSEATTSTPPPAVSV